MHFAFTDDQLLFRDAVRDLLDKQCQAPQLRHAWAAGNGRLPEVWAALAEMGVVGIQVPEASGGLGLTELDFVLLLEHSGRVGLPDPLVETAAVAAPMLAQLATLSSGSLHSVADEWLPRIADGSAVVAVSLDGSPLVSHATNADLVVVAENQTLWLVTGDDVTAIAQPSIDGARDVATISWDRDRAVRADSELMTDEISAVIAAGQDRGALGSAAQLIGLAQTMLDMTVDYVQQRQQFGVPIGSFQAVKHHLADAALRLEFARPVVYAAAYAVAMGESTASRSVAHAKSAASDAAALVGRHALQCHGAIGYTVEYDLHLYLKRVWALAASWGDAAYHRGRIAEFVLGPVPFSEST